MRSMTTTYRAWLAGATCLTAIATSPVLAQTAAPAAETPRPGYWINGIHLSAQLQAGIIANPAGPKLNNGQLFGDRPNTLLLNQLLFTAEKKLDPRAAGYDWGFKLSAMYGSDARYIHFLGILDQALPLDQRNQLDLVEATASIHFPVLTSGGIDLKAGFFVTPLGYELIDPATNAFYSHSYIFNYGLPFKHTGFLATVHLTGLVDLYGGLDTGANTTFGANGENNSALGGIFGFGLNMMGGNLTVLALTHVGAENPARALTPFFNANSYMRWYNDVVVTWKATDKLTIAGEASWARDDFGGITTKGVPTEANAFGAAGYVSYAMTETIALNARAEVFRDDNGFFVAGFPSNFDNVRLQKGLSNTAYGAPAATYGALSLGFTYKPVVPAPITSLIFRPELRYDQSLGGNKVFNRGINRKTGVVSYKDTGSVTIGADMVLTF